MLVYRYTISERMIKIGAIMSSILLTSMFIWGGVFTVIFIPIHTAIKVVLLGIVIIGMIGWFVYGVKEDDKPFKRKIALVAIWGIINVFPIITAMFFEYMYIAELVNPYFFEMIRY